MNSKDSLFLEAAKSDLEKCRAVCFLLFEELERQRDDVGHVDCTPVADVIYDYAASALSNIGKIKIGAA